MAATAWSVSLDQILDEVPGYGWKFTGTATASGATLTTTDPEINKLGTAAPSGRFEGRFLYIPGGTVGTDQIHSITSLSVSGATTTITTLGTYGATYTNAVMYIMSDHPDVARRKGNDALGAITVENMIPLYHGPPDADLQDTDTVDSSWGETAATDTATTTASGVWAGKNSLVVTDSGSGGGLTQSALLPAPHDGSGTAFGIVKPSVGTSALRVIDNSGNIHETVTVTQREHMLIKKRFTLDAADNGLRLELVGVTASAAASWTHAWVVKDNLRFFRLPTSIDERFRFVTLARAVFHAAGDEADTWLADSVEWVRLKENEDYRPNIRQGDANPTSVILEPHVPLDEPLFIIVAASYANSYGVDGTFSTDASTNNCPPRLLVPYVKHLIGLRHPESFPMLAPTDPTDPLSTLGYREYMSRAVVRVNAGPKRERRTSRMFA